MVKKTYNSKAQILSLSEIKQEGVEKAFEWVLEKSVWIAAEQQAKRNIFSSIGISAESVLFTLHPTELSSHNLLFYKGNYHFISRVNKLSPTQMELETAMVSLSQCRAELVTAKTDPETKLVEEKRTKILFPGILTEKYQGYEQAEPAVVVEKSFALIVPKRIFLEESDLVYIQEKPYVVHEAQELDAYKNEYVIYRKGDA